MAPMTANFVKLAEYNLSNIRKKATATLTYDATITCTYTPIELSKSVT